MGGCIGSGIVLALAIQGEFSLPTHRSPAERERESRPLAPLGGRGEGAVVMATNIGEIRVHAKTSSHQREARHWARLKESIVQ